MRFAVIGAGGVGGYFGGRLAEAGHDVVLIARGAHLEAIRSGGLQVDSIAGDFAIRPAQVTDTPTGLAPVDVVLVCVKAWQVRQAALDLQPLLGASTFVVPLQNGVEAADELAVVLGGERVVGGLCKILSFVVAPGRIRHAGVVPRIEFGERDGHASARVEQLRAAFAGASGVSVQVPADIQAALWEKFLFIAPFSGVGAVTRQPAGGFRSVPETRAMLLSAMQEVFELARARGVALHEDAVARTLGFVDGLPDDATASMQRDILEGRPSELEYQNGAVVRLGRQAGLAVPVHECLYRSLLPAELRSRGTS